MTGRYSLLPEILDSYGIWPAAFDISKIHFVKDTTNMVPQPPVSPELVQSTMDATHLVPYMHCLHQYLSFKIQIGPYGAASSR